MKLCLTDYVEGRYVSPEGDNVLPIGTLSILRQATQGMLIMKDCFEKEAHNDGEISSMI